MTTHRDIALLRLAAQRIAGPGFATATDAVRWLTAVQAQDYPGAVTSIALRTEPASRQSVEAALNAGAVVRSWPMRGTLHFVLAEDLPWMLDLTTKRVLAGAASRRAQLGLDMPTIERLEVDGVEYFVHPETTAWLDSCPSRAQGVFLLPGFDEYMLGYQDRGAALPAEFAQRIVPGNNGMQPTVIADGKVIGTWKRAGRGSKQTVLATPFTSFSSTVHDAVSRLHDALP
ncbi:MAG: DNA glycosylase AlkZ-like family protein [Pseudonocardiaceae bacterium]